MEIVRNRSSVSVMRAGLGTTALRVSQIHCSISYNVITSDHNTLELGCYFMLDQSCACLPVSMDHAIPPLDSVTVLLDSLLTPVMKV